MGLFTINLRAARRVFYYFRALLSARLLGLAWYRANMAVGFKRDVVTKIRANVCT